MPLTKTEQRIAKAGPDDVRISFHVADPSSPDAGQLIASVHIETENGGPLGSYHATLVCTGPNKDAGLTAGERTALRAALLKMRDAAITAAGFVDEPV